MGFWPLSKKAKELFQDKELKGKESGYSKKAKEPLIYIPTSSLSKRRFNIFGPRNTAKAFDTFNCSCNRVLNEGNPTTKKVWINGNDPSAGSPTETLLRLHLPLNDEV